MTSIDITQFEGYDLDEFKEFLQAGDSDTYQISIPKETVLFFSSSEDVSWEFSVAAYIGEQLSGISESFSYSDCPLSEAGTFDFEFITKNKDALSDLLLEISSAFGNTEIREPFDFSSEVEAFVESADSDTVACPDFLETAREYRTDKNGEEDDD